MLSHGPPSPPWTLNAPDSPAEILRSWLSKHGVIPDVVDRLSTKYNRRQHNYDQEYSFLALLKDVVTARKIGFATPTDLDGIDMDFGHAIRSRNSQLREQSDSAVSKIALATVRLLPDNIRHDFLNFIKSDSINARHRFLVKVLPWMSQNLKRKRSDELDEPDDEPYEGQKQPQPKRIHANRNIQKPRRSARLAAKEERK
ncbi:hypothetical protein EMCG_03233 [[Emmonsia] crescens]|uniref:Uncharacterized protein n=1 Tax=[Emmonsia] crescens TaxID=73230 RepID=A0A0G2J8K0_9EURO|nr:hypothetical protein EMCG_03233 [Emmonsia crescens UAMH 3008]